MPTPPKKSTDELILPFLPQEPRQSLSISSHLVVSIRSISHPSVSLHASSHSPTGRVGLPVSDCVLKLPDVLPGAEDMRACKQRPPDIIPPDACQTFILPQSHCGHCGDGWQPPERDPDAGLLNPLIISFITHKEQLGRGGLGTPVGELKIYTPMGQGMTFLQIQ